MTPPVGCSVEWKFGVQAEGVNMTPRTFVELGAKVKSRTLQPGSRLQVLPGSYNTIVTAGIITTR